MSTRFAFLVILLASLAACARPAPASPDSLAVTAKQGAESPLRDVVAKAPFTVFVFVSADCPCLHAHLDRLRAIAASYAPRGVQFFAVDSEVGATPERAAAEKQSLALPFDVLVDRGAKLADAFGAEYATFTVVVDRAGRVHYRGGIDSDKRKLHDDATSYLTDALDDVLAGRPTRRPEGKALGCTLSKW